MNTDEIIAVLKECSDKLPDCPENAVILCMMGNLHCGIGNYPLMNHAADISRQILNEITTP